MKFFYVLNLRKYECCWKSMHWWLYVTELSVMGHVAARPLFGPLSWRPITGSGLCGLIDGRAPVDECKGRLPVVLVRVCSLFSRTFFRFWFCGSRKTGTWLRFQELLSAWFDYWLDVAMFGARTSCARWFAPYNVSKLVFGRPQRLTVF